MQITTTFRDMAPSPALQACVERWAARLEQVSDRIVGCDVAIEQPHRHHHHGSAFRIHIMLAVPGAQLAVSNQRHEDAYVALADAFRTARRRLLEHVELQRGFIKPPAAARHTGVFSGKA